jgi:hypothetical protein
LVARPGNTASTKVNTTRSRRAAAALGAKERVRRQDGLGYGPGKIYPVMCEELDWKPHKWQPVAVELRKLTGKRKVYRWVDGHRRRAYPV